MTDGYTTIPDFLQDRDQWLYWNSSNATPRKPLAKPEATTAASWSDPDEWVDFASAVANAEQIESAGIGYVNAIDNDDYPRGLVGSIDIDGAADDDAVYEVVYCSSAKSEPSKTYAMPESRLLRIETEAADNGRPVADRIAVDILTDVFGLMERRPAFSESDIEAVAGNVDVHPDAVDEARELADVALTIGGGDDD